MLDATSRRLGSEDLRLDGPCDPLGLQLRPGRSQQLAACGVDSASRNADWRLCAAGGVFAVAAAGTAATEHENVRAARPGEAFCAEAGRPATAGRHYVPALRAASGSARRGCPTGAAGWCSLGSRAAEPAAGVCGGAVLFYCPGCCFRPLRGRRRRPSVSEVRRQPCARTHGRPGALAWSRGVPPALSKTPYPHAPHASPLTCRPALAAALAPVALFGSGAGALLNNPTFCAAAWAWVLAQTLKVRERASLTLFAQQGVGH